MTRNDGIKTYGDLRPGDLLIWTNSPYEEKRYVSESYIVIAIRPFNSENVTKAYNPRLREIYVGSNLYTLMRVHGKNLRYSQIGSLAQYWWDVSSWLPPEDVLIIIR